MVLLLSPVFLLFFLFIRETKSQCSEVSWSVNGSETGRSPCLFTTFTYTIDIDVDPSTLTDLELRVDAFDVDYFVTEIEPETDVVYLNEENLGILRGADNSVSLNTFPLLPSQVRLGSNTVFIDVDTANVGWCLQIDRISIQAKTRFDVDFTTPQPGAVGMPYLRSAFVQNDIITVEFNAEYRPDSVNDLTFRLFYNNAAGNPVRVPGSVVQLTSRKLKFVPNENLRDGIRYTAQVIGGVDGIKRLGGGAMCESKSWFFWTAPNLLAGAKAFKDRNGQNACGFLDGNTCPPLDVEVIQSVLGSKIVRGKDAVARIHARWQGYTDVLDAHQVKAINVEVTLRGPNGRHDVLGRFDRPDQIGSLVRSQMADTINILHTPRGNSPDYIVEVSVRCTGDCIPVRFQRTVPVVFDSVVAKNFFYKHFFIQNPGFSYTNKLQMRSKLSAGDELMERMFPVLRVIRQDMPDYRVPYRYPSNNRKTTNAACVGQVNLVECVHQQGFTFEIDEITCILYHLQFARGTDRFVAASVPSSLCGGREGLASQSLGVVIFFEGGLDGDFVIAHEIGHIYRVAHDSSCQFEGVDVNGLNTELRSCRDKGNYDIRNLMEGVGEQPNRRFWIDKGLYDLLIDRADPVLNRRLALTGQYLFVSGVFDTDADPDPVVLLNEALLLELPRGEELTEGVCFVELLDVSGEVLSSGYADVGYDISSASGPSASAGKVFSLSIDWDTNGHEIRANCSYTDPEDGSVRYFAAEFTRSANAPTVTIDTAALLGGFVGTTVYDSIDITWTGEDLDSSDVSLRYQLQVSLNNGVSWAPVTSYSEDTSYTFDTTALPNGNVIFRVVVSDGFLSGTDQVDLIVANDGLLLRSVTPFADDTGVALSPLVRAEFVSDVDEGTLQSNFRLLTAANVPVPTTLAYDNATRTATLRPNSLLAEQSDYQIDLGAGIQGTNGETFNAFSSAFTTGKASDFPRVLDIFPRGASFDQPINGLVQIVFNKELNQATVTSNSVKLISVQDNEEVACTIRYYATGEISASGPTIVVDPVANLAPNANYRVQVTQGITDTSGNELLVEAQSPFRTGSSRSTGARILGLYDDEAIDGDKDGLYDNLEIYVFVEVLVESSYSLNARLQTSNGNLILWQTTGTKTLKVGVHELVLRYEAPPIRNTGQDGPYVLDSVNFYALTTYHPSTGLVLGSDTISGEAYRTFAYRVEDFYSVLRFGPIEDQSFRLDDKRRLGFNVKDLTEHDIPNTEVSYSLRLNSDKRAQATIEPDGSVYFYVTTPDALDDIKAEMTFTAIDAFENTQDAIFNIRFVKARPKDIKIVYSQSRMVVGTSQKLLIQIFNQFGEPNRDPTTVFLKSTIGTLTPRYATGVTTQFVSQYRAPLNVGTAIIYASFSTNFRSSVDEIRIIVSCQARDARCFNKGQCCLTQDICFRGLCKPCRKVGQTCDNFRGDCCGAALCRNGVCRKAETTGYRD